MCVHDIRDREDGSIQSKWLGCSSQAPIEIVAQSKKLDGGLERRLA